MLRRLLYTWHQCVATIIKTAKMTSNKRVIKMDAGKAIRHFQSKSGMSCIEVSAKLGVTPQQFSRWRKSTDIKLSLMLSLCEVFDISPAEFVDFES